jgi:hypothetical protein
MIHIDKFIIVKELGYGMFGTVYMVRYKTKYYALKIEKIIKENIIRDIKYPEWREIEFSEKFGNQYPNQFIKLFAYDIITNCEHVQKYPHDGSNLPPNRQQKIKEKISSTYCIRKIYSLVDTTCKKIVNNLDLKQLYSMIIQTAYIIDLLNKNGYSHNDLHSENIGVKYTKKKYIKIYDKDIPTFGYIYKAIDYGSMTSDKWSNNTSNSRIDNDMIKLILRLVKYKSNIGHNNKLIKKMALDQIILTEEYIEIQKYSTDTTIQLYLFQILHPKLFQSIYNQKEEENYIEIETKLSTFDIVYFFQHINNIKKIIKFFTWNLSNIIKGRIFKLHSFRSKSSI